MQSHEQFIRLLDYEKMFNLSIMERDMDRVINTINKKEGLPTPYAPLWRNALHINAFLFPIEKVNEVVIQQIKKHWIATLSFDETDITEADLTKEVEEKVITYLKTHRVILYEDFLKLVDANATSSFFIPTMFRLYRIEVNERAFVQVIEEAHSELSYALLAKKIYSVFMQIPIDLVGDDLKIMSSCLEESFPYFLPDGALKTIKLMA